jgi:hypothetical protein
VDVQVAWGHPVIIPQRLALTLRGVM